MYIQESSSSIDEYLPSTFCHVPSSSSPPLTVLFGEGSSLIEDQPKGTSLSSRGVREVAESLGLKNLKRLNNGDRGNMANMLARSNSNSDEAREFNPNFQLLREYHPFYRRGYHDTFPSSSESLPSISTPHIPGSASEGEGSAGVLSQVPEELDQSESSSGSGQGSYDRHAKTSQISYDSDIYYRQFLDWDVLCTTAGSQEVSRLEKNVKVEERKQPDRLDDSGINKWEDYSSISSVQNGELPIPEFKSKFMSGLNCMLLKNKSNLNNNQ